MTYEAFLAKGCLTKQELLALANGTLVEDPPPELSRPPAPPLLMIDRVTEIRHCGLTGRIVAEQDVALDAWYFLCHFRGDPVQPGCLGLDAIWQIVGLYCVLRGASGAGRALGCKRVEFYGQIRPHNRLVRYEVDIRRFSVLRSSGTAIAIGTGRVYVDGEQIYSVEDAKVGLFRGIQYDDYPNRSRNSVGGGLGEPQ